MSNTNRWDFSGWATKTDMRCSDGRTIKKDAFRGCDGLEVPLVWNHRHNDPSEVLGHALLENREDGVYAYCSFNDSEKGREAKELVRHGDIKSLSIYANQLIQSSKNPPCDVIHGTIREVSLVLAGANPGAFIDNVLMHGEIIEDEAEIFHVDDDGLYFYHADESDDDKKEENMDKEDKTVGEVLETLTKEQKAAVGLLIQQMLEDQKGQKDIKHADEPDEPEEADEDDDKEDSEETIGDVINTLSPKQRKAVEALIGMALSEKNGSMKHADEAEDDEADEKEKEDKKDDSEETIGDVIDTLNPKQRKAVEALVGMAVSHNEKNDSDEEEDKDMKHNAFDTYENDAPVISHADQAAVIELAKSVGSLKRAVEMSCQEGGVLAHAITDHNGQSVTYGVANIDYMFPDARMIGNQPELISNNQDWVNKVINGTHHTPFSRVKSLFADITGADARARGYVKGNLKAEEVIEALQRETTPQTIYKKQKLDRDDILDITDFDVVAWLKAEMQIMLKAEIARAILIGDGRASGNDKIKEANVRPIYNDADVYTVKVPVNVAANATDAVRASAIIDAVILSRKLYKGSGNPTFFINEDFLGQMLILKDGMGRRIYETEASLAAALRVKELVPVDVMDGQKIAITEGQTTSQKDLVGIIVNLQDYNVGADKGGATSFFDDFDIDYNQYKYLYETRMSGALIKPYSAMSIYMNPAA